METEKFVNVAFDISPLRPFIKGLISEELSPRFYDSSNPVSQVVVEEVENNPKISDKIARVAEEVIHQYEGWSRIVREVIDEQPRELERALSNVIDYGQIASEIEVSVIADEISVSDIADEVDLNALAAYIDTDALTTAVVEIIDYKLLARELITALMERPIKTTPNA
jgi:phosphate uptake regulator